MKVVPPPLSRDYTSLSDHIDLDESQMSYGTKFSTSSDSKSVSNDFVSYTDSDKSLEVNKNDFVFSDSSVKSLKPKPNDSTSCTLTFSDLPSFFSNSSDKNEHTSRTSCNKNGYFNKKAGDFRKNASSVSKNKVNHQNQFVPQAVLLRTGKVNIPLARPQPVPTGKPKVFALVPTGRPNRPFPVPTDREYSPTVSSGWWKRIDGQLLLTPQQVVLRKHIEKVYTGYPRTIVDLIHLHTNDNVADLLTKALDGPRYVVPTGRVIVPTGRVIVATGRYVVPTGRVIVPTGRCVVPAEPSSRMKKSTEAPIPFVPEVPQSPVVSSHTSSGPRRKSLARKHLTKPKSTLQELDLDADAQTFIKSTKHLTTLRQIFHMVDRQDLVKLYGLVVQYYDTHPVAGVGLIL
nr:hypothetical protein [Tanacetum cinerariifolium]